MRERLAKKMGVDPAAMTLKDGRAIAENRAVDLTDLVDENIVVTGQIAPGKQEKLHTIILMLKKHRTMQP